MRYERYAHLALRVGAAFAFLYPPVAALSDPVSWASYFPSFVRALPFDQLIILHSFGAIEAVLALWILSGRNIRIPSLVATAMLIGIVAFNLGQMDVVFRDLSIAALTLALALWPEPVQYGT
jgi:uncharacterized membrane protein YphA (DoxX/SURF4 family)